MKTNKHALSIKSNTFCFSKSFVRHLEIEVLGLSNVPLPSPPSLCVCLLFNLHPDHSPDHLSFWVTCSGAVSGCLYLYIYRLCFFVCFSFLCFCFSFFTNFSLISHTFLCSTRDLKLKTHKVTIFNFRH